MIEGIYAEELRLGDLVRSSPSSRVTQVSGVELLEGQIHVDGFHGNSFRTTTGMEVIRVGHVHPGTDLQGGD